MYEDQLASITDGVQENLESGGRKMVDESRYKRALYSRALTTVNEGNYMQFVTPSYPLHNGKT